VCVRNRGPQRASKTTNETQKTVQRTRHNINDEQIIYNLLFDDLNFKSYFLILLEQVVTCKD